jgi:hypothetical protein
MRLLVLVAGAFVFGAGLAGCGKSEQGAPGAALPDWVPIASTTDGGQVQFQPQSIARDAVAATTDITIKITYPNLETWTIDLPAYVEHKTFAAERVRLRFDCAAKTFAIVRREALANDGSVKETITPPLGPKDSFKPIDPGGVASVAQSRACPAA